MGYRLMENLRWILIFAGVAILVLLYFSGRSSSSGRGGARAERDECFGADDGRRDRARSRTRRPVDDTLQDDPLMTDAAGASRVSPRLPHDMTADFDGFEVDPDDLQRPAAARAPHDFEAPEPFADASRARRRDPVPPEPSHDGGASSSEYPRDGRGHAPDGIAEPSGGALGGLSQKIEAIGARLSSRRAERVAENAPAEEMSGDRGPPPASKVVTLHVVARDEEAFDGQALIDCFERRGLEFGDMNIFHSTHHDKTVFSIAKTVEPGWFDPHDLDSFTTPGITLILQLPGPVAADTAFEVLLSEAFEIAAELDGRVLDGDRSTLSKQTAQHMREGIYEYMHRQKYFGSVAS